MTAATQTALALHLDPLLPALPLGVMAGAAALLLICAALFFRRGIVLRALCAAAFFGALLNPSLVTEIREGVPDVAVIINDQSPSQSFGKRKDVAADALTALRAQAADMPTLEMRYINAPPQENPADRETRLFESIEQALADVPHSRRAGVVMITDGQVHDAPADPAQFSTFGPLHVLLTGRKDEVDRQLVIVEAPAYGIVGQNITIKYRIEDHGRTGSSHATVIIRAGTNDPRLELIPVNEDSYLTVPIEHAGQNIIRIEASAVDNELTLANNRAPIIINGVRDRLRVLLVSGQPHAGGRMWRNLLTSDPAVDLVHFTILREPDKMDLTPQNELALIAFPFRELFEVKLYDFDLIIFDQYKLNRILPNYYFANIARYVEEGGALLEASGPSFTGPDSIFTTALRDIIPGAPTGPIIEQAFTPQITATGNRHPVTQGLQAAADAPAWGPWLRQVAVTPANGDVLMSGANDLPLLLLDHVGKGRVAQLASDHIWLWARGYQGGGPQAELLRRLAHWLMKEPELEENALHVATDGANILITRRALNDDPVNVTITTPNGEKTAMPLTAHSDGVWRGQYLARDLGIYTVDDGTQERFAVIGELNQPELRGVVTTDSILAPVATASNGSVRWIAHDGVPAMRMITGQRTQGGRNWIGLRQNHSYAVTGVQSSPLVPAAGYAAMLLLLMLAAWWLEGRSRRLIPHDRSAGRGR